MRILKVFKMKGVTSCVVILVVITGYKDGDISKSALVDA
jgi:hypothetical protein